MKRHLFLLPLAVLFTHGPRAFAPDDTVATVNRTATTTTLSDPTLSLLEVLHSYAVTPAEMASVTLHQGDLEQTMNPSALLRSGIVGGQREAFLFRAGIAYSDFGKMGAFKEWLTKETGHKIGLAEFGVTNPSHELYAVLQGVNGAMWNTSPLKERKAFYEPLMKMLGGPVIGPKLSYAEIISFAGAMQTIPGTNIQIPKYPMFVGYMHEWQGVLKSYLDAKQAIDSGKGPLAGTVRNLDDYSVILETVYGHNGSGPTLEAFSAWFRSKYHREPKLHEVPFWIQAHGIVKADAAKAGVPIFEGSLQEKKYAGSERRSPKIKYSLFHRSPDRVDGVIHPEKIYEEIAFLGPRNALTEAYFGGNYNGSVNLQGFTKDVEIPALVESGDVTRADAEILRHHFDNQVRLAEKAWGERVQRISFNAGDSAIPANQVAERVKEITNIGISTPAGTKRFDFKVNEAGKEGLVDHSGQGEEFMPLFKKRVFQPAYDAVTKDPRWRGGHTAACPLADLVL